MKGYSLIDTEKIIKKRLKLEKITFNKAHRGHTLIGILGIVALALLMLASIAGAAPFAYIANLNSNTVSVIDIATNTVTAIVTVGYGPQGIAATQDGNKVYVTNSGYGLQHPDSSVSVIDTATNTVIKTVTVGNDPIRVAVTPDGKKVYVSNTGDHTVSVIDTATNTIIKTVNFGGYTGGIAVTPDGKRVYVANYYDHGTVSIIDTATDTVTATVKVKIGPYGVAITPDGTKVYVTYPGNNAVSVIDTATNTVINTLMLPGPIGSYGVTGSNGVAVTPDGKKVYVTNSGEYPDFIDTVSVIDTKTDSVTATVPVGQSSYGVAVSPDGTSVYVTNSHSNDVSVIDTATNRVTATVPVGPFPYGVAFTPLRKLTFPVANFSSNITEDYAPLIVQFTDLSENATEVRWDFDNDGVIDSTERNPEYTYTTSGTYTVNLTATNANGTDSKLTTITVLEQPILPIANFTSNITQGYAPLSVQFNDISENTTSRDWDFDSDGNIDSEEKTPVYVYTNPGTYTATLAVRNTNGTASKNVTINVFKATPTITWSNPADITAGTALSITQLNAVASVPGTFVYYPASGTVLSASTHTLRADFTPTDTANYNTTSMDVTINVLKATPTITWNNPTDIVAGTVLNSTQLNATASIPGTFSYTPTSGTALNAGTQVLHVNFTPSDSANYTTASKDVTINVVAAPLKNPTITWSNPEDIIYGTALSSTQLNATASVPGTFVYTPPSGTVLSAGTQTLHVDFTPTDTVNYNSVSQTTTINVLTHVQGIQKITTEVQSLNLIPEQANLLVVKLDTATKNLNAGNTNAAANELNAFINQVSADVNSRKISSTEGQALIDAANTVINAIDPHAASVPEFPSVVVPIGAILGLVLILGRKKE